MRVVALACAMSKSLIISPVFHRFESSLSLIYALSICSSFLMILLSVAFRIWAELYNLSTSLTVNLPLFRTVFFKILHSWGNIDKIWRDVGCVTLGPEFLPASKRPRNFVSCTLYGALLKCPWNCLPKLNYILMVYFSFHSCSALTFLNHFLFLSLAIIIVTCRPKSQLRLWQLRCVSDVQST